MKTQHMTLMQTIHTIQMLRSIANQDSPNYDPQDYHKMVREGAEAQADALERELELRIGWRPCESTFECVCPECQDTTYSPPPEKDCPECKAPGAGSQGFCMNCHWKGES